MSLLLRNLSLSIETDEDQLKSCLAARLGLTESEILSCEIVRKGIDARRKRQIRFVYSLLFSTDNEEQLIRRHQDDPDLCRVAAAEPQRPARISTDRSIVIVGSGPAGLFAALRLADYGINATIIERGRPVEERVRAVQAFWGHGILDPESNVQFGEGGAGTFSDGKLTTRVRDPNSSYVLQRLVEFGAPPEVGFLAKPHIGTDRLRQIVVSIRQYLERAGSPVLFSHRMTGVGLTGSKISAIKINGSSEIPCEFMILAPGNSARDTYLMLEQQGVALEPKPFAVGVRIEHPQELINRIQYGFSPHKRLPPADYALTYNDPKSGRSAYSFCMCPGGVVVAAASEIGTVVTNGMSNHLRNSPFANSALVVTVGLNDFPGESPLAGVTFQRNLEKKAYLMGGGGYIAPAQNLLSFIDGRLSGSPVATYRPGVRESDLAEILPDFVTSTLRDAIRHFNGKMRGFLTSEATLIGVETRTSAPVRIVRGSDLCSVNLDGLYPAGEGAGYAGGIMSAALDGIRVADVIAGRLSG